MRSRESPGQPSECLYQVVNALGRNVGADVAEGEGFAPQRFRHGALPARHALQVKAVVQVDQFLGGKSELIPEAAQQVHRRGDEHVHRAAHLAHVGHAAAHPLRPVGGVQFVLPAVAGEVA